METLQMSLDVNGLTVQAHYGEKSVEGVIKPLLRRLSTLRNTGKRRSIAFLAAPPGAGKSTFAKTLETLAAQDGETWLQCISIDGFHMTNEALRALVIETESGPVRGIEKKGAPETYDTEALRGKLSALLTEDQVYFPVYDRNLHEPVQDAALLSAPVVLLEGNWLLFDGCGWEKLREFADLTIFIDAEEEDLKEGLVERKMRGGKSREEAEAWFLSTDGPNIRRVKEHFTGAEIVIDRRILAGD
ncbi:MAG: nucleoside/nucleotide kinase family protein [Lachnospiraceae bacterium]|nr:nucleoside/nucleotide kinase family protein [Lachnospiraceae bacterium]